VRSADSQRAGRSRQQSSRVLVTLQRFGERPVGVVAGEDVEAVAVELQGEAIRATRAGEDGDIAMEIFVRAEPQGQGRGGGVILSFGRS
jgi:hypothetical protein